MRFTAALANGRDLYAFRFAENDTANTLYFREDGERLIVVSEPFDKEPDWTEVPPNHALVALASKNARIVPFWPAEPAERKQELPRLHRVIGGVQ
jgi:glutamine amidotransferase